jgi:hypothetical protein
MPRRLAGYALVVVAALAATPALAQKPTSSPFDEPTPAERVRLGELLDVVRHAQRVEALPVEVVGEGLSSMGKVVERPVAVDAATGRRLGRILLRHDWDRGSMSACMFEPGVAFRFRHGDRTAQVQICFKCGEMAIDGVSGQLGNKQKLGDAARRDWRRAAQKAFPAGDFQSLP